MNISNDFGFETSVDIIVDFGFATGSPMVAMLSAEVAKAMWVFRVTRNDATIPC